MTMSALLDSLFPDSLGKTEYKFHGDVFKDFLL